MLLNAVHCCRLGLRERLRERDRRRRVPAIAKGAGELWAHSKQARQAPRNLNQCACDIRSAMLINVLRTAKNREHREWRATAP